MKKEKKWIISGFTETTEGIISHKLYRGIRMPVKLDLSVKNSRAQGTYPPIRRDGKLVYAMPGGLEFVE